MNFITRCLKHLKTVHVSHIGRLRQLPASTCRSDAPKQPLLGKQTGSNLGGTNFLRHHTSTCGLLVTTAHAAGAATIAVRNRWSFSFTPSQSASGIATEHRGSGCQPKTANQMSLHRRQVGHCFLSGCAPLTGWPHNDDSFHMHKHRTLLATSKATQHWQCCQHSVAGRQAWCMTMAIGRLAADPHTKPSSFCNPNTSAS